MDAYYEKPAATIVNVFTNERMTVDDTFWIAQWAHAHAFPKSVVDKMDAFCRHFLDKPYQMEYASGYEQDTLF